jgi:hypothetical protein
MATRIVIVTGYDNELVRKDIEAIKNIKRFDRNKKYAWTLLYYVPNIPGRCLMEKQFRIIEQDNRDKARVTLQNLSKKLGIPLPMSGTLTHYNDAIHISSTVVTHSVKKMKGVHIILTSNPDKLKFDIFDNTMKWIKTTKFWQYMSSKFMQFRPKGQLIVMSPKQFQEQHQKQRLNW